MCLSTGRRPGVRTLNATAASWGCFYSASYGENADGSEEPYFYTAYNMHWEPHAFALPNLPSGYIWHQVLDTAEDSMNGFLPSGKERHLDDQKEALVLARSIQVFAGLKCPEKKKNTKQRSESEPERRNVIC